MKLYQQMNKHSRNYKAYASKELAHGDASVGYHLLDISTYHYCLHVHLHPYRLDEITPEEARKLANNLLEWASEVEKLNSEKL